MRRQWSVGLLAVVVLALGGAQAQGVSILFMSNDPVGFQPDVDLANYLQSVGHTVNTMAMSPKPAEADQVAAAMANDVVLISQSIASTAVSTGGTATDTFYLKDVPRRIVSYEAFMFDEAKWTGPTAHVDFGNTGRPEVDALGLGAMQDTIYITNPGHALAAGLNGAVQVYSQLFSVNFAKLLGPGATVIATADAAGQYPTEVIYETGSMLYDGSIAPAPRIVLFLGQQPAGNPANPGDLPFSSITADGLKLIEAAVVPEPAAMLLVIGGLVGLLMRRR